MADRGIADSVFCLGTDVSVALLGAGGIIGLEIGVAVLTHVWWFASTFDFIHNDLVRHAKAPHLSGAQFRPATVVPAGSHRSGVRRNPRAGAGQATSFPTGTAPPFGSRDATRAGRRPKPTSSSPAIGRRHASSTKVADALKSLLQHDADLRVFLTDPRVPPDNNGAERTPRHFAGTRLTSFGSGSPADAEILAAFLSVRGRPPLRRLRPPSRGESLATYLHGMVSNDLSAEGKNGQVARGS